MFLGQVSNTPLVPGEVLVDPRTGVFFVYDPTDTGLGFNPFKAIGSVVKGAVKGVVTVGKTAFAGGKALVRTGIKVGSIAAPIAATIPGPWQVPGLALTGANMLFAKGQGVEQVPGVTVGEPIAVPSGPVTAAQTPVSYYQQASALPRGLPGWLLPAALAVGVVTLFMDR